MFLTINVYLFYLYILIIISEKLKKNKNENETINQDVDIVEQLKLKLKSILMYNKILNTTIDDIQPYGSRISGVYTAESDIDFHISYSLYYF